MGFIAVDFDRDLSELCGITSECESLVYTAPKRKGPFSRSLKPDYMVLPPLPSGNTHKMTHDSWPQELLLIVSIGVSSSQQLNYTSNSTE